MSGFPLAVEVMVLRLCCHFGRTKSENSAIQRLRSKVAFSSEA